MVTKCNIFLFCNFFLGNFFSMPTKILRISNYYLFIDSQKLCPIFFSFSKKYVEKNLANTSYIVKCTLINFRMPNNHCSDKYLIEFVFIYIANMCYISSAI